MNQNDPITERARALPRSVAPERDLWPEIAAHLDQNRTAAEDESPPAAGRSLWRPLALAAGLLLATILGFWLGRSPDGGAPDAQRLAATEVAAGAGTVVAVRTAPAGVEASRGLHETRLALLQEIEQRVAALPPSSREVVIDNVRTINRALDEISSALAGSAGADANLQLLMNMYADQLVLLNSVNNTLYPNTPEILL
ncbi:MAG TPA: hypothetical protein VIS76_16865 [Pseudomonadales bacterium]